MGSAPSPDEMSPHDVFKWEILADAHDDSLGVWEPLLSLGPMTDDMIGGLSRSEREDVAARVMRELHADGLIAFARDDVPLSESLVEAVLGADWWREVGAMENVRFRTTAAGDEALAHPPEPLASSWLLGAPALESLSQVRVIWPEPRRVSARERLSETVRGWFSVAPKTFRFPTDCSDPAVLRRSTALLARDPLIAAARLRRGRRGACEIEIMFAGPADIARARAAITRLLPAGVSLVGGPTPFAGATLGS